ncbi:MULTISPECIES: ribose-5-phosphate isomerase RpiA [Vitreoscilla]|uniref:Ribose-5-phosphate isomerase A n=1 Tax=Vitreoscilla stercoraria TaxID=61 RepID=A0ABY4EAS2_VITST|nr:MULTISPECIES: ribose-5-phosphate isomerase RpiA [Vitreoscilla]AUZ05763.1 ribose-5-phosphate isomerase A [Vitreoscilla sp. C1]UOO92859.1 ribose-5-phosphate isomerase RpiA [Vitreoscilla stercoraria]
MSTQDNFKRQAARKALEYVPHDEYIGVGSGSTVAIFIEELASIKDRVRGVVAASIESRDLLEQHGIKVVALADVGKLPVYFDGADEVNHSLQMIKGGGAALLGEKIVAHASRQFICMAGESKYVSKLGAFPLPVEVVPFARSWVASQLVKLGGRPVLREGVITRGGHEILDVHDLEIYEPMKLEDEINRIPGVMENGVFARHPADVLILGHSDRAEVITVSHVS